MPKLGEQADVTADADDSPVSEMKEKEENENLFVRKNRDQVMYTAK
jgi:hypothetical protein